MNRTRYERRHRRRNPKRDDALAMSRNKYSVSEIARVLELPERTVRTWIDLRRDP